MTPKKGAHKGTHLRADWQDRFLSGLRDLPNVTHACKRAQVSRNFVYEQRKEDAAFATAWDEALEEGLDAMDGEMMRRAFKGTLEPMVSAGKKVCTVRKYSDTLAIFLAKAHRPERYRDTVRQEITGKDGGPVDMKATHEFDDAQLLDLAVALADAERARRVAAAGSATTNGVAEGLPKS